MEKETKNIETEGKIGERLGGLGKGVTWKTCCFCAADLLDELLGEDRVTFFAWSERGREGEEEKGRKREN